LNQAVNAGLFSGGDVAAMMGVGDEGGNWIRGGYEWCFRRTLIFFMNLVDMRLYLLALGVIFLWKNKTIQRIQIIWCGWIRSKHSLALHNAFISPVKKLLRQCTDKRLSLKFINSKIMIPIIPNKVHVI
jgi:hypothetical protein